MLGSHWHVADIFTYLKRYHKTHSNKERQFDYFCIELNKRSALTERRKGGKLNEQGDGRHDQQRDIIGNYESYGRCGKRSKQAGWQD